MKIRRKITGKGVCLWAGEEMNTWLHLLNETELFQPQRKVITSWVYVGNSTKEKFTRKFQSRFKVIDHYLKLELCLVKRGKATWLKIRGFNSLARYLQGTKEQGLKFDKNTNKKFEAYVDAVFGGDPNTRKSTKGFILTYEGNTIHWKSLLQKPIASSTAEEEYVAICDMTTELLFLAYLASEAI